MHVKKKKHSLSRIWYSPWFQASTGSFGLLRPADKQGLPYIPRSLGCKSYKSEDIVLFISVLPEPSTISKV